MAAAHAADPLVADGEGPRASDAADFGINAIAEIIGIHVDDMDDDWTAYGYQLLRAALRIERTKWLARRGGGEL